MPSPQVPGYELQRPLSLGLRDAQGDTWLGKNAAGADIVLKCYREPRTDSEELIAFVSRAASMAVLGHPAVARVADRGRIGDTLYTVREYFPLGSLATLAERFDPTDKRRIVVDIGRALEHAHRRGLAHGAVKPENVLFGALDRPMLVDFTLGFSAKQNDFSAAQARTSRIDALADQYSLAALASWLLLGHLPSASERICESPDLDQALRRALSPFPDERFRTLDPLIQALEAESAPSGAQKLNPLSSQVERSGNSISVRVSGKWTPESVSALIAEIGRALDAPGAQAIGYVLQADSGCHSAAIEALADLHFRYRRCLKRVGFVSDSPQARGTSVLIGRRADIPWRTFASNDSMQSWLTEVSA